MILSNRIKKKLFDMYGDLQFIVAMEEFSELIKEIAKFLRSEKILQSEKYYLKDMVSEIVDCKIMLEQLEFYFNKNHSFYEFHYDKQLNMKLARLKNRLGEIS